MEPLPNDTLLKIQAQKYKCYLLVHPQTGEQVQVALVASGERNPQLYNNLDRGLVPDQTKR